MNESKGCHRGRHIELKSLALVCWTSTAGEVTACIVVLVVVKANASSEEVQEKSRCLAIFLLRRLDRRG